MAKQILVAKLRWIVSEVWFKFYACVAQLDRVPGYEPGGRRFESFHTRHFIFKPQAKFLNLFIQLPLLTLYFTDSLLRCRTGG